MMYLYVDCTMMAAIYSLATEQVSVEEQFVCFISVLFGY